MLILCFQKVWRFNESTQISNNVMFHVFAWDLLYLICVGMPNTSESEILLSTTLFLCAYSNRYFRGYAETRLTRSRQHY